MRVCGGFNGFYVGICKFKKVWEFVEGAEMSGGRVILVGGDDIVNWVCGGEGKEVDGCTMAGL